MKKERSFRARWSEELSIHGHTQVSNVFLRNYSRLGISSVEALCVIHVFEFKWTVDCPFPSFNTIADRMGKSRNSVQAYIRSLEKRGFIKRVYVEGKSSRINLSPLIEIHERVAPYQNSDREFIKNLIRPCLFSDTKEELLKEKIKGKF